MSADEYALEREPCPRCVALSMSGALDADMVMPVPPGARAKRSRVDGMKICTDCGMAEALQTAMDDALDFQMARVAIGNDRQDQLRLPGAPLGLVRDGFVTRSAPGDLEAHHAWMTHHHLWPPDSGA